MSEVMTVRVERQVKQRLEKLAKATARSQSCLAAEAIRAYLDLHEWQISKIKAGLREADAGEFATDGIRRLSALRGALAKKQTAAIKKWAGANLGAGFSGRNHDEILYGSNGSRG